MRRDIRSRSINHQKRAKLVVHLALPDNLNDVTNLGTNYYAIILKFNLGRNLSYALFFLSLKYRIRQN